MKVQIRHSGPPQPFKPVFGKDFWRYEWLCGAQGHAYGIPYSGGSPCQVPCTHDCWSWVWSLCSWDLIGWASERTLNKSQSPGSSNSSECSICSASLPLPLPQLLSMCCPFSTKLLPTSLICAVLLCDSEKGFQNGENTPLHLASSFPSCFYNNSVGRGRVQVGLLMHGVGSEDSWVALSYSSYRLRLNRSTNSGSGRSTSQNRTRRRAAGSKTRQKRGSRRGWDSRDPARRKHAQDSASSRTFLEHFWTVLQPRGTSSRRSRSALGSLEGAAHIGINYLFSFSLFKQSCIVVQEGDILRL